MGDNVFLAANCLVPLARKDVDLSIGAMKETTYFFAVNMLSESDRQSCIPEDDDFMWISGIFEVPDWRLHAARQTLRELPFCKTVTLISSQEAYDKSKRLNHHPRFPAWLNDAGLERVVSAFAVKKEEGSDDETVEDGDDDDEDAVVEIDAATFYDPDDPKHPDNLAPQVVVEDDAPKVEAEIQDGDLLSEIDSMAQTVQEIIEETQPLPQTDQAGEADAASATQDETEDESEEFGYPRRYRKRPRRMRRPLFTAYAAPPPSSVPTTQHEILGPWRRFTGRLDGLRAPLNPPSQAALCAISTIACNRSNNKEFFTNVCGKVDSISLLMVSDRQGAKGASFWKLQLVDLITGDQATTYVFPKWGSLPPLGTPLSGLKPGDMLLALDIHVLEGHRYISVKDRSSLFVSELGSEATVSPMQPAKAAP